MDLVSSDHSWARHVFYAQSSHEFRPVSLDEILNMLIRYENSEEGNDVSPNESAGSEEATTKLREDPSDLSLADIYFTDF